MDKTGRYTEKKILIVDDSEMNRAILKDMLETEYEAIEAADGEEALACIRERKDEISLILLDIVMPKMDGFEALAAMAECGWTREIPVIMISAEVSPAYVERAFSLGATDYISRPFNMTIVLKRVQNTIALYSREGESFSRAEKRWEQATASARTLRLLEEEREKYQFFAAMSQEIQFEYDAAADLMCFTTKGAREKGFRELIARPFSAESELLQIITAEDAGKLQKDVMETTYQNPIIQETCQLNLNGEKRWCKLILRAMWSDPEEMHYKGFIGKIIDIHEEHEKFHVLEQRASLDLLTGLYNQVTAKSRIEQVLAASPDRKYGVLLFDLDCFKEANDQNGHLFGNDVLKFVADKIRNSTRKDDIAARIGGDEFLIFMEYNLRFDSQVQRLFRVLTDHYGNFKISVSMGISLYPSDGTTYDEIFECADKALYASKRSGKSQYRYYNENMKNLFSVLSPIER